MADDNAVIKTMDAEECWSHLRGEQLGRLAMSAGGEIDIFPVNYVADGETLVFRTAPGTKLVEAMISSVVAFEIDGSTESAAWSVVAKGPAARIELQHEIDAADALPLTPWAPTLKFTYVRITPTAVTGRWFQRGPEPDRSQF
jgi:nitroimidazol reductase NimA-like FMN-containing flavoprotein (pyridoxamine 5'-phosphate oxidase superfamily)